MFEFTETLTIEVPDVEEQVSAFSEKEYKANHGLIIEIGAHTKVCIKCDEEKVAEGNFDAHPSSRDRFYSICKPCVSIKNREYREKNKDRIRQYKSSSEVRKRESEARRRRYRENEEYREKLLMTQQAKKYGMTVVDLEELLESQDYVCAICKSDPVGRYGKLHIDHCHETGRVRGALCHHCNVGIGNFNDDIQRMKDAIAYLDREF